MMSSLFCSPAARACVLIEALTGASRPAKHAECSGTGAGTERERSGNGNWGLRAGLPAGGSLVLSALNPGPHSVDQSDEAQAGRSDLSASKAACVCFC